MAESSEGRVEALWIKRTSGGLMDPVDKADLLEKRGMVGNAHQGGRRQVTILAVEAWTRIEEILGEGVDPSTRRANVLVRGIDLERSRGRILALGECRVRIRGETRPCTLMESAKIGLRDALDPEWRGGAFGEVVLGGRLSVGAPVSWVEVST